MIHCPKCVTPSFAGLVTKRLDGSVSVLQRLGEDSVPAICQILKQTVIESLCSGQYTRSPSRRSSFRLSGRLPRGAAAMALSNFVFGDTTQFFGF
jgi:hypothetical protein